MFLFTPINYSLHVLFNWTVNQGFSESWRKSPKSQQHLQGFNKR